MHHVEVEHLPAGRRRLGPDGVGQGLAEGGPVLLAVEGHVFRQGLDRLAGGAYRELRQMLLEVGYDLGGHCYFKRANKMRKKAVGPSVLVGIRDEIKSHAERCAKVVFCACLKRVGGSGGRPTNGSLSKARPS